MGFENLVVRTAEELGTSAKNILVPQPYTGGGRLNYVGEQVARSGASLLMKEPLRLTMKVIAGIGRTTFESISTLIGSTVRLTGRAALSMPLIAAPK